MSAVKVLIAVDGSQAAMRAVDWAAGFFAGRPAPKFLLIHVEQPVPSELRGAEARPGFLDYDPMLRKELETLATVQTESILRHAARRLDAAGHEVVEEVVAQGQPSRRILEAANARKADLIVVGHRGLTGLSRFLQGSVSSAVVREAKVPVVVVP